MTQCQQCEATLIADGLSQGQQVRCVKCAHLFRLGEEEKTSADRLAWRSFWLGLFSLLFLFFTGIPAIYYGIRSMLRMRFTRSRPKDRFAAVSGTMMGGCFGIIGGAMIAGFAAVLAFTLLTVDKPDTPEAKLQLYSQVFRNEPPALQLESAVSVLDSQFFFDFVDHEEREKRTIRVHLLHHNANFQPFQAQVVAQVRNTSLNLTGQKLVEKSSELLTWEMLDQEIDVRKIVYEIQADQTAGKVPSDSESDLPTNEESSTGTAIKYYGLCKSPFGYTGISVTAKQPQPLFTEEKIRELFATIKPIK